MIETLVEAREIIIAGLFTVIGAAIGFVGTVIQSKISAKNNIALVELQGKRENEARRHIEKEKLYSDIIELLPQLLYHLKARTGEINLPDDKIAILNSLKARLKIYSTPEIHDKFYELTGFYQQEDSYEKRVEKLEELTKILIEDLEDKV